MERRSFVVLTIATAIGAALVTALALWATAPDRREAGIIEAALPDVTDPELRATEVTLSIDACHGGDNRAAVTVDDERVVITVSTDAPAEGDDCADGLTVELPEMLAGRPIIDGSTGEPVPLV